MEFQPVKHHVKKPALPIFILSTLLLQACISFNLPSNSSVRAQKISFTPPPDPYISLKSPEVDQAWQSPANGNTIAYLSECNSGVETSLDSLAQENLGALSDVKIRKVEKKPSANGDSIEAIADGTVDETKMSLALYIFKKDKCSYVLSFMSKPKHFNQDLSIFEKFKEGFHVP